MWPPKCDVTIGKYVVILIIIEIYRRYKMFLVENKKTVTLKICKSRHKDNQINISEKFGAD